MTEGELSTPLEERAALSVEQTALISNVGRSKLYREIREGRLVARKVGARTIILRTDREAWLGALPALPTPTTEPPP